MHPPIGGPFSVFVDRPVPLNRLALQNTEPLARTGSVKARANQKWAGPPGIAFVSKSNLLCRLSDEREMAASVAIDRIEDRESVEYEVIPI